MKLTVGKKIVFGFGLGVIALVIVSLWAYLAISSIYDDVTRMSQIRDVRRTLIDAEKKHLHWDNALMKAIIDPEAKSVDVQIDPRQCDFGKWYYSENRKEAERLVPVLIQPLANLESAHTRLHQSAERIDELLGKNDRAGAAASYLSTIALLSREIVESFSNMTDIPTRLLDEGSLAKKVHFNATAIGLVSLFFAVALIIIAYYLSRNITTVLKQTTASLSTTATEIASTITQHERTASQQASAVNETTTTIDELGASSRQTSEQAASASESAEKSAAMTEEGARAVKEAIEAMGSLNDKIGAVAEKILKLGEQTAQVGSIANLVKDIAGQTNMLALNAAVEAARAGEHGKGFAVVASEVRKLADQSKKSAEQASILIAEIQKATNSTIMKTEEGANTAKDVTALAQKIGGLFNSLSAAANNVYENAQQVMLNARQQSAAISQVVTAMNSINTGTRETAAGISQTKIGIDRLNEAAQELKGMV